MNDNDSYGVEGFLMRLSVRIGNAGIRNEGSICQMKVSFQKECFIWPNEVYIYEGFMSKSRFYLGGEFVVPGDLMCSKRAVSYQKTISKPLKKPSLHLKLRKVEDLILILS